MYIHIYLFIYLYVYGHAGSSHLLASSRSRPPHGQLPADGQPSHAAAAHPPLGGSAGGRRWNMNPRPQPKTFSRLGFTTWFS